MKDYMKAEATIMIGEYGEQTSFTASVNATKGYEPYLELTSHEFEEMWPVIAGALKRAMKAKIIAISRKRWETEVASLPSSPAVESAMGRDEGPVNGN